MSKTKKLIRQIHLWLGLVISLPLIIVAITGAILVFERELAPVAAPMLYTNHSSPEKDFYPVDDIIKRVNSQAQNQVIQRIYLEADSSRSVLVQTADLDGVRHVYAVDRYTGEIQTKGVLNKQFFRVVLGLHRFLLVGEVGKMITGLSCFGFVIIIISGLILWVPKKIKNAKQRLKIKWTASSKRLNWDLHVVPGFYAALFALALALTGLVWSYKWYEGIIYYATDGKPKPSLRQENESTTGSFGNFSMDKLLHQVNQTFPFNGDIRINIGDTLNNESIMVQKVNLESLIPNQGSFVYFDGRNGEKIKTVPYDQLTTGTKVRRLVYPIHTGSIFGLPTKIMAFITCLIMASSPITGFFIWRGRKKKKGKRELK
ncbi:PepSY-associated TM helix domain-containing protein [Fulvivirga sediminis]|uniref:PepSY domain-containing protein n=1 Tax=Fulvivirga sediminis TaxID=2803949 RepID=A0A937F9I5_9BACT|nr:PepSY-associated TM helix domain-containing protein [Fulvivirga sediminis]MBL3657721.1 PepSY domain-containing protein [Fulvivirga sediminis]